MSHPEQPQDGRQPDFEAYGADQTARQDFEQAAETTQQDSPYGQSPYSQASAPEQGDPYGQQGQGPYSQSSAPEQGNPYDQQGQTPYSQSSAPEQTGQGYGQSPYNQQSPSYDNQTQQQPSYGQQANQAYGQTTENPQAQYGQQAGYGQSAYGQSAYGQSAYGQQPDYSHSGVSQQDYGQQYGVAGYGNSSGYQAQAEHPQATMVLVMAILSFFTGITAFVAWYLGGKARKEIQAGAPYAWDGGLKIGYWIGKIYSIIQIVALALLAVLFIIAMIGFAMSGV